MPHAPNGSKRSAGRGAVRLRGRACERIRARRKHSNPLSLRSRCPDGGEGSKGERDATALSGCD
eukprot:5129007-Heterocapsa_arctica.AAC.1